MREEREVCGETGITTVTWKGDPWNPRLGKEGESLRTGWTKVCDGSPTRRQLEEQVDRLRSQLDEGTRTRKDWKA